MLSSDLRRNLFRIWVRTPKRTLPQSTGPKRGDWQPNDEDPKLRTPGDVTERPLLFRMSFRRRTTQHDILGFERISDATR